MRRQAETINPIVIPTCCIDYGFGGGHCLRPPCRASRRRALIQSRRAVSDAADTLPGGTGAAGPQGADGHAEQCHHEYLADVDENKSRADFKLTAERGSEDTDRQAE